MSGFVRQNSTQCAFTSSESWVILNPIEQSIKRKIEAIGTPLKDWDIQINYGIKTGCNEAFIITDEKREEILANCKDAAERKRTAEIIRPILRGRDIKRYGYTWANLYLIATFPARHYDIEQYPAVKQYLLSFDKVRLLEAGLVDIANNHILLADFCRQRLEQSGKDIVIGGHKVIVKGETQKARKKTGNKWFETQDQIGYWDDFNKPKIVYREISDAMNSCILREGVFINNKCYMLTGKNLAFLLGFFNSTLFNIMILSGANSTGGKGPEFLLDIKVPNDPRLHERICDLVDQKRYDEIEDSLDVYYNFTLEEIVYLKNQSLRH